MLPPQFPKFNDNLPDYGTEKPSVLFVWIRALMLPSLTTFEEIADEVSSLSRVYRWIFISSGLSTSIVTQVVGPPRLSSLEVITSVGLIAIVLFAITTGIVHLIAGALGGTGTYTQLAVASAAYATPLNFITSMVELMPVGDWLTPLLLLYGLVLHVIALKAIHQLTWEKTIIPIVSLMVLGAIGAFLFFS